MTNQHKICRRAILLLGTILATGVAAPAMAQLLPPDAPPIQLPSDPDGVDLASGKISTQSPGIVIGAAGQNSMTFSRQLVDSKNWKHDYFIFLQDLTSYVRIDIGPALRTFTKSGSTYISDQGDGSTLVSLGGSAWRYTAADGTIINFDRPTGLEYMAWAISKVTPDGERLDYFYNSSDDFEMNPVPMDIKYTRIQSVVSNQGYHLKFTYTANSAIGNPAGYMQLASAQLINSSVDYCDPTALSCGSLTQTWPLLTFSTTATSGARTESVTELAPASGSPSPVTQYIFDASNRLTGIKYPSSSSNDVTVGYDANSRVSSVAVPGRTTNYTFTLAGTTLTGLTKDSASTTYRTTTADTNLQVVLTDKDGAQPDDDLPV